MKAFSLARLGLVLLLIAACSFCFAQTYTMKDVGTPPGDGFFVLRAINASGEVTGAAGPANGSSSDVVVYNNGTFTDFGTLGGNSGIANGINKSGQVAGYSTNSAGAYRAFISNGNSLVDIGDLGGGSAVAYGINDAGQVVGSGVTSDGSNHPFLYSQGQMIDLGTLGSPKGGQWWNSAQGINNSSVVVGTSYAPDSLRGFIWQGGTMTEMGTLGGSISQAYAVNNLGQVTGIAYLKNGEAHAFIANSATKLKDLGLVPGSYVAWGFAINDSGWVVGFLQLNSGAPRAFVYNGKKMKDLNKLVPKGSGLTLIEADSINNAGQIGCVGEDSTGNLHAVVLTPKK